MVICYTVYDIFYSIRLYDIFYSIHYTVSTLYTKNIKNSKIKNL